MGRYTTTPQQYERLYRLFESACGLEPSQRSALLDRECAGDPTMRRQVEDLLAWDRDPTSFLESTPLGDGFGLTDVDQRDPGAAERQCGQRIDHYLIREILGEGGIAVVYLAEQEKPVRRRVALKMIKPGMDSRQVIARFEAERQALAMMDHVCVAKVFDAGSTEAGRPYFVMELVPGVPITEHCDRQRLSIDDRLKLFMQVCEGVQHAHQKGIIHRDLKPSNVLVEIKDGQAVPKVIDFGVAKALHQRLTERTVYTEQGQLIGTPAYMSPEQAEMTAQDIDTRSDIYSLGVLLYELLTGAPPFDARTLRQAGFGEIQRIIREEEPPKPSTWLSSNGDDSTTFAQECRADPRSLVRELRGDLDWIVMKALEKDRTRRYETAHDLAMDIRRHLEHEPVQASPPSRAYRLRKFVRRHRAGVAAGVVAAISLIAAAVVSAGFAVSEAQQRRVASTERDTAQAVIEFLNDDLLGAVAPSAEAGKGRDVLMRDVLDEAARRIEETSGVGGRFEDKPLVEASIRHTLGVTYMALDEFPAAEPHLERARELRRHVLGEEHPDTLSTTDNLVFTYIMINRADEAEPLALRTLELRRRVLGGDMDTMKSMVTLARLYRAQRRYDEAELLCLQSLEMGRRVLDEHHPDTVASMDALVHVYFNQGRYEEAELLYLETLGIEKRVLGKEHPATLESMHHLAYVYAMQRRLDEAESLALKTFESLTRVIGEGRSRMVLAIVYERQGRHDEAETLYLEELEVQTPEGGNALVTMDWLAILYGKQGRYDEAESLLLKTIEIHIRRRGEEHPETLRSMLDLLTVYGAQGRYEEAEPVYPEMIEISKRILGEVHWITLGFMNNLAILHNDQGRYDQADSLWLQILEIRKRVLGEEYPDTLGAMRGSISGVEGVYSKQGRFDDAESLFLELIETSNRVLGEEHPDTRNYMSALARVYAEQQENK